MATTASQASHFWHQALKYRKHLLKQIEKLQAESTQEVDISHFVVVENLLEKFRLSFVHTIFLDISWAVKENVEEALWGLHISINTEYRRIQGRIKHSSHVVVRRRLERSYHNFLRVAQKFYKGYIQRLAARYDVPELRRIAKGIDAQPMEDPDQISPVLAELRGMVLTSCHSTLLRMGDLSRYRAEARHRNSGYESALNYYGLAHQLKPKSGQAYHQMGIVHLGQGNHLDVVYYFYRSWAVESSPPHAKANLETEFKSLHLPNSSGSRQNSSDTQDAFSMWFVRLHALYYKGEDFPQQAELEGEIMHRLEMACCSEKSTGTLIKMALVNIAAHHVAAANYRESQTAAASRFYHFTLRFNALFMSHFCATFEPKLREAVSADESSSESVNGVKLPPIVEALLPILRVYTMWIAARRQEIRDAAEAFGGVVPTLVQNLAKVFALLCVFSYSQDGMASCPYLLPEDFDIRGFIPLSATIIPEACRCFCGEDGTPKTYLGDSSARLEPAQESSARVLDILRCAYFLAEDVTLPVSYRVADSRLTFEYSPGACSTTPAATSVPTASQIDLSREIFDIYNNNSTAYEVERLIEHQEPSSQTSIHQTPDRIDLGPQSAHHDLSQEEDPMDDDATNIVFDMLAPFLAPPSPQSHQQQDRSPTESSYGMHTGTANELLGSFQTDPSPTRSVPSGVPSGKFVPLPWAWFNTPSPDDSKGSLTPCVRKAFSAEPKPDDSPLNTFATETVLDDPFATPGRHHYGASTNGNEAPQTRDNYSSSPAFSGAETTNQNTNPGNNLLQAFSATNIPRSSPFTHWDETQRSAEESGGSLPRQSRVPQLPQLNTVGAASPHFTDTPGFSHPSSLYAGTPANVGNLGLGTAPGQLAAAAIALGQHARRYYQIDETTSSYNEAIMQAAYCGDQ
ncbi:hypothetical protein E4U41_005031 [Claviceps citrina]|nr:hypothetical protein E4U41_005031 [Claviceps citrina]